jgi:hypothetical protein
VSLPVLAAYIPEALRARNAWVVWRMEQSGDRVTKVPYDPKTDFRARSDASASWTSWHNALAHYTDSNGDYDGIGFMLAGGAITCIDLDHCITNNVIDDWAVQIAAKVGSYTEVSQSGEGLHIFVIGIPPRGRRRKGVVEMYGPEDNRYIAVTGQKLAVAGSTPLPGNLVTCDLTALHAQLFPQELATAKDIETETKRSSPPMTDEQIYAHVHRAANAGKFAMLAQGDWSAYGDDPSAARMALLGILAFYTQDADQLVAMAADNGFDRPDDERKMRNHDIPNTLASLRETYTAQGEIRPISHHVQPPQEHSFKLASDVEPQDVDWLWEPWLPYGMLTMLDGDPGIGKSFLALEIAARISIGSPMPPMPIQPDALPRRGVVLVMPEDDNAKTIVPRLIALGADRTRIVVISKMFDASADDGIVWLEEAADKVDACLVIFDPLLTYLGGERSDTHKDRDVRRALDPIIEMAIRRNIAILGNRHLSKGSKESSALYRGMGSIGIVAVARVSWIVARNPEEGKGGNVLAVSKCNLAPKPKSLTWIIEPVEGKQKNLARVTWTGDTILDADQLATGPERKPKQSNKAEIEDAINAYLADCDNYTAANADMLRDIHDEHGDWSVGVIEKWRAQMDNLTHERVKGMGSGTVWTFKKGHEP